MVYIMVDRNKIIDILSKLISVAILGCLIYYFVVVFPRLLECRDYCQELYDRCGWMSEIPLNYTNNITNHYD